MVVSCKPYTPAALYCPGSFLVLISVRGCVDLKTIMGLEGLGKLKKFNNLIGNITRDLSVCSEVPQPNTLPRAPPPKKTCHIFSILAFDILYFLFYLRPTLCLSFVLHLLFPLFSLYPLNFV
jgi:hypothetical protein